MASANYGMLVHPICGYTEIALKEEGVGTTMTKSIDILSAEPLDYDSIECMTEATWVRSHVKPRRSMLTPPRATARAEA